MCIYFSPYVYILNFYRPATGLLDLTSKFAQGVKNTATYYDDKIKEGRDRNPRMFYGRFQFYKTFDFFDNDLKLIL